MCVNRIVARHGIVNNFINGRVKYLVTSRPTNFFAVKDNQLGGKADIVYG